MPSITDLVEPHRRELELATAGDDTITTEKDANGVELLLTEREARRLRAARDRAEGLQEGGNKAPAASAVIEALERLGRVRANRLATAVADTADPAEPTLAELAAGARRRMIAEVDDDAVIRAAAVQAWRILEQAAREHPEPAAAASLDVDSLVTGVWRRIADAPGGSTVIADKAAAAIRLELGL